MLDEHAAFNAAYQASLAPEIVAMEQLPYGALGEPNSRVERATELAAQGFIIDVPIQVWGWDPWQVMTLRQQYGFKAVPDALNKHLIPVTLDPLSFPPYVAPAPPPSGPVTTSQPPLPPPGPGTWVLTPFGWSKQG